MEENPHEAMSLVEVLQEEMSLSFKVYFSLDEIWTDLLEKRFEEDEVLFEKPQNQVKLTRQDIWDKVKHDERFLVVSSVVFYVYHLQWCCARRFLL